MALVSPMPATPQQVSPVGSLHESAAPGILTSRRGIEQDPNPSMVDDTIFVAVAKEVKDSRLNLIWAVQNSGGKRICILYIHVPAATIPMMGAKFPASSLEEHEVKAYREIEKQSMHKILDDYLLICQRMGVRAEKLHIERDCIEKGIVELISQHNIRKLVMGAASDKHHTRRMTDLRSKKAIYVCEHAPAYCHIQFICKAYLIHTRDRSVDGGNVEVRSPLAPQTPNSDAGRSPHLRSHSFALGQNQWAKLTNPAQELFRRISSTDDRRGKSIATVPSPEAFSTPQSSRLHGGGSPDDSDGLSMWSPSVLSSCSDSGSFEPVSTPNLISEGSENALDLNSSGVNMVKADLHHSSPPNVLEGGMDATLYDQLEQAMAEAENARRDAYQETVRRGKAEKNAVDAIRRTKTAEIMYKQELKLREELEEALKKEREEQNDMKSQRDKVKEELRLALDQKSSLESQIASTELTIKELQQKIKSTMDMLQSYKNERDDLQTQRDNALREAEELRRKQGEASTTHVLHLFSEFSFSEIEEATSNFNPSLKIGEGGYGSIFKGILRRTEVAIKTLDPTSKQGPAEFQQEVEVLSKLRHPNLITLVGACPDSCTLVYEYLPNGSLEDRLSCKDNTPPLSWQTRVRIAVELCSALVFLHSTRPHSIVHGDLKPANILLDANLVSKLGDFGISRVLSCCESSSTQFWRTDPKGTFAYMDPEFFASGELTPQSDVYSFGIILLRLLTGRPAVGITKEVKYALDAGKLNSLLDPSGGDWPLVQAEQLARLALRCCEINRKNRPDLCSDVWRVLEPMRASTRGKDTLGQPPPYFICPISQEVMRDPHVAADGYTYEAEAIRGWLDCGHETSPVTNSKLAHRDLVPNHALHSAVQDWLRSH